MTLDVPLVHQVHATILRYSKHPSIIRIKERANETNKFFKAFKYSELWDEVNRLNTSKKTRGDIPAHMLMTSDLSFNKVTNVANSMVQSSTFPDPLKLAHVSPVYKDGIKTMERAMDLSVCYLLSQKCLSAS